MNENSSASSIDESLFQGLDWPDGAVGDRFVDTWRQVHYAAQVVAEAGKSWGVRQPDDSHSSLEWSPSLEAFVGVPTIGGRSVRAALRVSDLTLLVLDAGDAAVLEEIALQGKTLGTASTEIRRAIQGSGGARPRRDSVPAPDLPDHPLGNGRPFDKPDLAELHKLERVYGQAHGALSIIAAIHPGAGPVRVWPHHFDIATLIELAHDDGGALLASIGVGLAVPEEIETSGYLYVSAWRKQGAGPIDVPIPHGRWQGSMALLSLSEIESAPKNERPKVIGSFLGAAIGAATDHLAHA